MFFKITAYRQRKEIVMKNKTEMPDYGNWVAKSLINRMLVLAVIFAAASVAVFFIPGFVALGIVLIVFAVFFLLMYFYFLAARYVLSYEGGGVQGKVLDMLCSHINGEPKNILDIGCGSGAFSIKLAKKFKEATVSGIDYWHGKWEYSAGQCMQNATLEGVEGRIKFQRASASLLPFKDEAFDLVVSNFTFHEVSDAKDKWDVVAEALRVLKPGGTFVFHDLFLVKSIYGQRDELIPKMLSLGVSHAEFTDTSNQEFITRLLKLPFMLGRIGMLSGQK
jgi:ubiquinone/menaquinone biosynthesis C-methylase UbiE